MDGRRTTNGEHTVWHFGNRKGVRDKGRESELTREYIIAAIVGVILVTSGLGGFPPAIAVAITLVGATVILMMGLEGWP